MDLSSDQQIQLAAETQHLQCHLLTAQVNGHQGLPHTHLNCKQREIKHECVHIQSDDHFIKKIKISNCY